MKTCTYISGRPCVGKTTVAEAVGGCLRGIAFIRGDDYWTAYPDDLPFEIRVSKTNQDILTALRGSDSHDVLCEWVPCRNPFVAQLHDTCISTGRRFLHVGLTAPSSVLQARRRARDGDDAPVGPVPVPDEQEQYDCMVFDTTVNEAARIAEAISKWILSCQELKATGEPAP